MKTNFGVTGSLGAVGLGLLAMLAAGCAASPGDEAGNAGENTGTAEAKIVPLGWGAMGCAASGSFDVFNGANDFLNFIAVDRSDFASLNSSLSLVDSFGQQTALNQSMVQADEAFQSMINTVTNSINAAQTASLIASQQSAVAENWQQSEVQQFNSVQTVANQRSAGSANTITTNIARADTANVASQNAWANQSAFGARDFGSFAGGPWLGGGAAGGGSFFNNNFVNSGSFLNNAASTSAFNQTAVHTDFAQANHTDSLVVSNSFLRTFLANRTATAAFAVQQANAMTFNQVAAQASTNQAQYAASRASTFVFNNLSQFASNRAILQVNAVSSAMQQNSLLRVFAGNQFGVTGWADFNTAFPACGAGVGVGVGGFGVGVPAIP
ncbi:MAG: hypothetical protein KF819_03515 [Labilithrix sp.]|nr:hypothetical protein [Labilithrix sp.]